MATRANAMPWVVLQLFDRNGDLSVGGWFYDGSEFREAAGLLYAYVAGTSTLATTYADPAFASANTNPVILDTKGRAKVFLDRTTEYKFVLVPYGDTEDPPTSPLWTYDNIIANGYDSIGSTVTRVSPTVKWGLASALPEEIAYRLDAAHRPVILYNKYAVTSSATAAISIPAGTLTPILAGVGDSITLEWEVDHASAIVSARSVAFGTNVDGGTGVASTGTRARYFFYRVDNNNVHVSTTVWQNTGLNQPQVDTGQQTIAGLDLGANDYTVNMGMAAGTYTVRGARAYYGRSFGDWQA